MARTTVLILALLSASQAFAGSLDTLTTRVDGLIASGFPIDSPSTGRDAIRSLGADAIPILEARLRDPSYRSHRAKICSMIGIIGAPEGFPILRAFVWAPGEREEPALGEPRGCTAEMIAQSVIGYIAKNSDHALKYLRMSTNPAFWDSLPWHCADGSNTRKELLTLSVIALSHSERSEARSHLVDLSKSAKSKNLRDDARRAVATFDEIRRLGLAEYERRAWQER